MSPYSKKTTIHLLLLVLGLLAVTDVIGAEDTVFVPQSYDTATLNRSSFPEGFVFGAASSAYQYEGAADVDGRGPSMWDIFTHKYPEKIADRSNGDVAIDQYHRYKEDVGIMKKLGLDAYRFSISWPRIIPNGKLRGGVNKKGIEYYNKLINELLANGIQPFVTLFHWDIPQHLQDEYGGFLSPLVVNDFRDFVDICFKEFGDRVKHWITMNEPFMYCDGGYALGSLAPGRCSAWQQLNCTGGDSGTEPYLVGHNLLLAHAAAVKLYREKYQASQKGKIGITLLSQWFIPYSDAKHNVNAASRSLDFMLGWFLDPIVYGDYPHSMRSLVRNRLPKFSRKQSATLKGSFDFVGLNYYTTNYAHYMIPSSNQPRSYTTDAHANLTIERNGVLIGPQGGSSWLCDYPKGIRELLLYVKNKYGNPLVYITENGIDEVNNSTLPLEKQLADNMRINYLYGHLSYIKKAIEEGANLKGYFTWSLMDDFEWGSGYTVRFGLNYIDFANGLKRYPKRSALWFTRFLKRN